MPLLVSETMEGAAGQGKRRSPEAAERRLAIVRGPALPACEVRAQRRGGHDDEIEHKGQTPWLYVAIFSGRPSRTRDRRDTRR